MDTNPASVTKALTLELFDASGAATPLNLDLSYDSRDPYAIAAVFNTKDSRVRWVFARDLLANGLYEPSGDGDVHVWPCLDARGHAVVIMELCSPDGEALMQARSDEVMDFLRRTEAVVATGQEGAHIDIDDVISHLFAA